MGAHTWIKKSYILVEKKVGIKISQISYREVQNELFVTGQVELKQ
jgi:hypothetical protein